MAELSPLLEMVSAQKRGEARGVFSVCSAHPVVLQAAFEQALEDGSTVLVESTSNQVNQEGGYTGARPAEFVAFVSRLAREAGLPEDRVVLGGDHLGPHPWTALGAASRWTARRRWCGTTCGPATRRSTSTPACAAPTTRPGPSPTPSRRRGRPTSRPRRRRPRRSARRASPLPVYVIGTEVPPPGGQAGEHEGPP